MPTEYSCAQFTAATTSLPLDLLSLSSLSICNHLHQQTKLRIPSSNDSPNEMIQSEETYLASSQFQSRDELLKGVRAFYWSKGYGLFIRNSRKDKFVLLKCDLGGSYRDTRDISDNRKRSTGTHLIECPFSIKRKIGGDGVWVFEAIDLRHNHEPSADMSGYFIENFCTMTPCTGHYMATMGLPCAHKIKDWNQMTLSLELIHPHWRINTLSLNREDDLQNDGDNRFVKLLEELNSKYQSWPLNKKEHAISMINQLVNESDILFEPVIQRPRGRPRK
ncbi:protein FAR1-related sequence 5 [Tanacetum coccineum]